MFGNTDSYTLFSQTYFINSKRTLSTDYTLWLFLIAEVSINFVHKICKICNSRRNTGAITIVGHDFQISNVRKDGD